MKFTTRVHTYNHTRPFDLWLEERPLYDSQYVYLYDPVYGVLRVELIFNVKTLKIYKTDAS